MTLDDEERVESIEEESRKVAKCSTSLDVNDVCLCCDDEGVALSVLEESEKARRATGAREAMRRRRGRRSIADMT